MIGGNPLIAVRPGIRLVDMRKLNRIIARALDKTAVSQRQLSEEAGYHSSTFPRYKVGARGATPSAARAFARVLRRRAEILLKLADQLDKAAGSDEGN